MPALEWRHRPGRWNARLTKFTKHGVTVTTVEPQKGQPFILFQAPWGPLSFHAPEETDDLETLLALYLKRHPEPPPEEIQLSRGPSVYDLIRRPQI